MSYNKETGLYEGFIYCITNCINNKKYIGQTSKTIKDRWQQHKSRARVGEIDMAICAALNKYGVDNFKIELVEKYCCKTKEELSDLLNDKEIYYIDKYNSLADENGYNLTRGGGNNSIRLTRRIVQYDLRLNYIATYNSILDAVKATNISYDSISGNCWGKQKTAQGFIFCHEGEKPETPFKRFGFENIDIDKYEYRQLTALMTSSWNGEKIIQYNLYGEKIEEYDNPIDLSIKYSLEISKLNKYIGTNKRFKETILLYESQIFDKDEIYKEIRPISVYDLKGNFQKRFISITKAAKDLGYDLNAICRALQNNVRYKDHLFSYYGELPPKTHRRHGREINMIDDNGNIVNEFICCKQIADYYNKKDVHTMINNAIKNKTKWNGFYWRYKDEVAVT